VIIRGVYLNLATIFAKITSRTEPSF